MTNENASTIPVALVPHRKGRPTKFHDGKISLAVHVAPADAEELRLFTLWLSSRLGKRVSVADAILAALRDSHLYVEWKS